MTHEMAYNISLFLCQKDMIEKEDTQIYTYGFEIFIDSFIETMIIFLIGILGGFIIETLFFISAFTVLRSYTGGYHASTKIACICITTLVYVMNMVLSTYMSNYVYVYIFVGVVGALLIFIYAPKSHTNKSLDDDQLKRYKTISRVICLVYVIGILILKEVSVTLCNVMGITLFQISILLLIGKGGANNGKRFITGCKGCRI